MFCHVSIVDKMKVWCFDRLCLVYLVPQMNWNKQYNDGLDKNSINQVDATPQNSATRTKQITRYSIGVVRILAHFYHTDIFGILLRTDITAISIWANRWPTLKQHNKVIYRMSSKTTPRYWYCMQSLFPITNKCSLFWLMVTNMWHILSSYIYYM